MPPNLFFFHDPAPPEIYTLSLHDALPIFLNVIVNAEQAMTEAHGKGVLRVSTCRASAGIRISIEDDGPGIQPDHLKQIFDPFFTTKGVGKGTGLGLSICHGIIKEHGGSIE